MPEATSDDSGERRYGTLEGVFVPTLLTILGVILFLRTGWVVGNAGLLGAVGLILVAFLITGSTALSLASLSTNVVPGAGGAFAMVNRSFGIEAGGAVGLPLYLSQSLAIVLYTFGFRDAWVAIFPGHPPLAVDAGVVLVLVTISLISTKAAFRVQYLILAIVALALGSVAVAAVTQPWGAAAPAIGSFPGGLEGDGTTAWAVFAVFFPATTGIMAGLNMSGELRDPRRSIMRGTLAALGVSMAVYLAVAVWLAFNAPIDQLLNDYLVMADRAAWAPAVLAGVLAATFSSALASLIGAPRILQALADKRVPPGASWLAKRDGRGEPRHALLITIVVVAAAVLLRDLNAIAPVITLTFLLTYGAINLAVLAETVTDLPSYRPTFRVPWPVPLVGVIGCLAAMAVIDPWATAIALLAVVVVLVWLARRDLDRSVTDIRGALLLAVAHRAGRAARRVPTSQERSWSPRFLVPVGDQRDLDRARSWIRQLADEGTTTRLVPVTADEGTDDELHAATRRLRESLEEDGFETTTAKTQAPAGHRGPAAALLAAGDEDDPEAANIVVAGFPDEAPRDAAVRRLLRDAFDTDTGVVLVPDRAPDMDEVTLRIALWVRPRPLGRTDQHLPRADLALLVADHLARRWPAELTLVTANGTGGDRDSAESYLRDVVELARLPGRPEVRVLERPFEEALDDAPAVDLHVLALSTQVDFDRLREVREHLAAPCLFARDSGVENAFA